MALSSKGLALPAIIAGILLMWVGLVLVAIIGPDAFIALAGASLMVWGAIHV